jgi:hypothetical protein
VLGELGQFIAALTANAADLPHLEGTRAKIETILAQAQEVTKRQAALVASKQDASKELRRLVTEGQRLATAARKLLQEQYGLRSEKLAEFGVQPFRGRTRRGQPATPTPTPAAPLVVPTPGGTPSAP